MVRHGFAFPESSGVIELATGFTGEAVSAMLDRGAGVSVADSCLIKGEEIGVAVG